LEGRLVVEAGCVWLDRIDGDDRVLAIWPEGSRLTYENDAAVVRTALGDLIGRAGETTIYGGGAYDDRAFIDSILATPIPAECASDQFWLVTESEDE
jgi:hypothetical protein